MHHLVSGCGVLDRIRAQKKICVNNKFALDAEKNFR